MRENMGLYRGKRKDNDEWIEGYYFERKDTQGNIIESIIIVDAYEQITGGQRYLRSNLGYESFRVDPKTVGEYTGLPDKNGKRIFEGDIIRHYNDNPYVGIEEKGAVFWDEVFLCFRRTSNGGFHHGKVDTYRLSAKCDYEVIGNVHDNPELLEVSGDE